MKLLSVVVLLAIIGVVVAVPAPRTRRVTSSVLYAINSALAEMSESGDYQRIANETGGPSELPQSCGVRWPAATDDWLDYDADSSPSNSWQLSSILARRVFRFIVPSEPGAFTEFDNQLSVAIVAHIGAHYEVQLTRELIFASSSANYGFFTAATRSLYQPWQADAAIGQVHITTEGSGAVDFSCAYDESSYSMLKTAAWTEEDPSESDHFDNKTMSIAVIANTAAHAYAKAAWPQANIIALPISGYSQSLLNNAVHFGFADANSNHQIMEMYPNQVGDIDQLDIEFELNHSEGDDDKFFYGIAVARVFIDGVPQAST